MDANQDGSEYCYLSRPFAFIRGFLRLLKLNGFGGRREIVGLTKNGICFQFVKRSIQGMNIGQIIVWIIVGGFAGTLAGRAITFKKEGLGLWANLLVGMAGAVIGGELFKLFRINFGFGELKVTFEDLIAAFLGSLLVILAWRIIARIKAKDTKKNHLKPKP
jgi:uncharacterized membrane protein YeaQ/YmgE (transglycosylase-associated protein family)